MYTVHEELYCLTFLTTHGRGIMTSAPAVALPLVLIRFGRTVLIRMHGITVNFLGETFLPENKCMKYLKKVRILHDICQKKNVKMPEFL